MLSTFKKLTFLINKKLKKKLILIYFITIIGTFLETLGIGVILPILKIIVEGKDFLNDISFHNFFLNDLASFLQKKSYNELVIFLLVSLIFIFFVKTAFFLFLIQKQTKFSHLVEYELAKQLNWKTPDWIIVPVGDGPLLYAIYKAFEDLQKIGASYDY